MHSGAPIVRGGTMNSFNSRKSLAVNGKEYEIYSLTALESKGYDVGRLPYSLRILLENLLRNENNRSVFAADIEALAKWNPTEEPSKEIAFTPARVILQDFTGVPCVVDLAAMRDAMRALGGDPAKINPLQPVELVIDHSVQVDAYGSEAALMINRDLEFERNNERYEFLKWGTQALNGFKVVPPNTGIVHQVNLEFLARVAFVKEGEPKQVYPDTLVGTDSHTTMVNGLGVLGWGVGGIEAEAAMLGQPVSMLIPQVVGFRLKGKLPEGTTATDLVLTVTEMLRKLGVVGKFVEFFGEGLASLPLADRSTIANMAPEYGATCGIFPVDEETLRYMRSTGRSEESVALTEAYFKEQGLFFVPGSREAEYTTTLELDLSTVQPSVAGPKRPQDRFVLGEIGDSFHKAFDAQINAPAAPTKGGSVAVLEPRTETEAIANASAGEVANGCVVVAAITSCTNTSNPYVMIAAGLVAKKAAALGLKPKPWVKTSLAPGSRVVTEIYKKAGLLEALEAVNFHVVGYGCTTCIGNTGPLPDAISKTINEKNLVAVSVLSGNRNFEGRISPDVKANYLMSPPLVVAFALAGTVDIDLAKDPIAKTKTGKEVYLKDIWPTQKEVSDTVNMAVSAELFRSNYDGVYAGDDKWKAIQVTGGETFTWDSGSTYIKHPPYFEGMSKEAPASVSDLTGLRALAVLGDSITTDHISPAGNIKLNSPAGEYLTQRGVSPEMFNSYGARRGHDDVMVRGTFANIRLKNKLADGLEGGFTKYLPTGQVTTIYDASVRYKADQTPLIVLAGKEYGTGSSRDWAAKGTFMLGVKIVLAQSFERIHRSNLVGMGVLPLEFVDGQNVDSLGLDGSETFDLVGLSAAVDSEFAGGKILTMKAKSASGEKEFKVKVRIDTPQELLYYKNGGILQYVLRQLAD